MAVDDAGVIERRPHRRLTVKVDYDDSGAVRGLLESAGVAFDAAYETSVRFDVRVPVDEAEALLDRIASATSGRATDGWRELVSHRRSNRRLNRLHVKRPEGNVTTHEQRATHERDLTAPMIRHNRQYR